MVGETSSGVIVGAGVDYFTATCASGDSRHGFERLGEKIVGREHERGNDLRVWRFKGYEGYTSGSASCGDRPDGSIIQCSSGVAADHWRDVSECATNFSRIDVQDTVRLESSVDDAIIRHLGEALSYADTLKQKREVRIIASRQKGNTLYLNERVSNAFGRAYNKFRESKLDHYQNCIRYELEAKGDLAQAIVRRLKSQPNAADAASGIVSGWMGKHGIKRVKPLTDALDLRCDRKRTTDANRLIWLDTQVRPSLEKLAASGKLKLAIEALGLSKAMLQKIIEQMKD
jgi:hypothetical protein